MTFAIFRFFPVNPAFVGIDNPIRRFHTTSGIDMALMSGPMNTVFLKLLLSAMSNVPSAGFR